MLIIIGVSFFILAFTAIKITKNILHPAVLIFLIWGIGIFFIMAPKFRSISLDVAFFYLLGIFIFGASSIASSYLFETKVCFNIKKLDASVINQRILNLFLIFLILILPFFLWPYKAYFGDIKSYFYDVRLMAIKGESILKDQNFIIRKVPLLSFSLAVLYIYLVALKAKPSIYDYICLTVAFISSGLVALIEGARSGFIVLIIVIFFIYSCFNKINFKIFSLALFFIFMIFGFISISMERGVSLDEKWYEIIENIFNTMVAYYYGGLIIFDTVYNDFNRFQLPSSITLNFLFGLLEKFGFDFEGADLLSEGLDSLRYVNIIIAGKEPFRGNVYTFFYPYINDYGVIGCLFVVAIIGSLSGIFFAYRKTYFGAIFYSVSMVNVVLSPFSDYFFSLLYNLLFLIFFAFIVRKRKLKF